MIVRDAERIVSPIAQLGQALAERVDVGLVRRAPGVQLPGDRRQHVGRGLNGRALQMVQDAADPAEFLTATGPSGTAVHEDWQR